MGTPNVSSSNRIRYAILGDIHANLEALSAVLTDARDQQCTRYACVGDIVGYNANPTECLDVVRRTAMTCVKGNHDEFAATDCPLDHLSPRAADALSWTRQQLSESDKEWLRDLRYTQFVGGFWIVHATLDAPQRWGYVFHRLDAAASLTYQNTQVCFFGHTHVPLAFIRDGVVRGGTYSRLKMEAGRKYFINVGSVGEPRDGNPNAAYVIYDVAEAAIELRRVPYDFKATEAKVRSAGLPPRRKV